MFYNANCEWLGICYMMLNSVEDKRPMPIKVLVKVRPSLECDLQGLKDSLTFGPADQISTKIHFTIPSPRPPRTGINKNNPQWLTVP